MVRMIGENGTEEMLRKAMLTITIGSNDILNYYIQPSIPSFSQDKLPIDATHSDTPKPVQPAHLTSLIDALQNSMVFHLTTHFKVLNIVLYELTIKKKNSLRALNTELGYQNTTFVYANSCDLFMKLVLTIW
ncbi:unnamed protein product [Brassica oleracea]